MSVLDELREGLLLGLHPDDADTYEDYFADVFRDFEALHPGLKDETQPCDLCGVPMCWQQEIGVHVADARMGAFNGNACPACAGWRA